MEYRVENKYLVSDTELEIIACRLQNLMQKDIHQTGSCYEIRSVYFDDINDSFLEENLAGVDCRHKYRVRIYNTSGSPIKLEIKQKKHGLTKKTSCNISKEEWDSIYHNHNDIDFGDREPLNRFLLRQKVSRMFPRVVIVYERSAYIYKTGNVRITFDRNITASKTTETFFEEKVDGLIPILPSGMHVLEVKYDELLPDIIAQQLEIGKLKKIAFSKYFLGRMAVNGEWFFNK